MLGEFWTLFGDCGYYITTNVNIHYPIPQAKVAELNLISYCNKVAKIKLARVYQHTLLNFIRGKCAFCLSDFPVLQIQEYKINAAVHRSLFKDVLIISLV